VDGFPEDKPQFVHHVDALLEKLSHIVSYEVCGFQLTIETCLKERKQLFRKAVLSSPWINQRDSVKAQMRQDLLEHRSKGALPLSFGTSMKEGGEPLEETQLEHVMLHHEQKGRPDNFYDKSQLMPTPVPKELSVERYAGVAMEGSDLFTRQLMELLPPEPEHPQTPPTKVRSGGSPGGSRSQSPASPASPARTKFQRMRVILKVSSVASGFLRKKRAKEAEQAEKRRREDLIHQRIVQDPLPAELRERSLDTAWVSPITNRLVPSERDRQGLRKPASEAFQLKMESPKNKILPPLISRSRSAPELRPVLRGGVQELPKLHAGDGAGVSTPDGGSTTTSPLAATFKSSMQKDLKAASLGISAKDFHSSLRLAVAEDLVLEPPPRLQNDVVMQRLEAVSECIFTNSFESWVKDFDITSGDKKQRMDEAQVRKAETTYVRSLQDLVGPPERPAMKMYDTPAQMAKRRTAAYKSASSANNAHGGGGVSRRHRAGSIDSD